MTISSLNRSFVEAVGKNDYITSKRLIDDGADVNAITDVSYKIDMEKFPYLDYRMLTLLFKNGLRIQSSFFNRSSPLASERQMVKDLFKQRQDNALALIEVEKAEKNLEINNALMTLPKVIVQIIIDYDILPSKEISPEENDVDFLKTRRILHSISQCIGQLSKEFLSCKLQPSSKEKRELQIYISLKLLPNPVLDIITDYALDGEVFNDLPDSLVQPLMHQQIFYPIWEYSRD